jgi:predicted LPLAT superfamily acyltransferase
VTGLSLRLPLFIRRRFARREHWSKVQERGGVGGMHVLFAAYRIFGRWAFKLLLYPVAAYFCLPTDAARSASRDYMSAVRGRFRELGRAAPTRLGTFNHIVEFGNSVLDNTAMWAGELPSDCVEFDDPRWLARFRDGERGSVFIGSHLGNVELVRAFSEQQGLKVNALVFTRHSPKFNRVVSAISPRALQGMIQVDSLGPDAVVKLQDRIRSGEHVAIVGDRLSVRHVERSIYAPFLGRPAPFPEGPFVLASLLASPVYLLFCLRFGAKYKVFIEPFADPLELPRAHRRAALEQAIGRYAERLEAHCLLAPTQWFNFFDFWGQAGVKAES